MVNVMVIDYETQDKYIDTLGAGWVFGDIDVIGAGIRTNYYKRGITYWETDRDSILRVAKDADVIVAHNLQYDVGILYSWGLDLSNKTLIDTKILAKLYDNSLKNYSLDGLSQTYLGKRKTISELGKFVLDNQLYVNSKGNSIALWDNQNIYPNRYKRSLQIATKYAYKNMRRLYDMLPELVVKYCKNDVDLTHELYNYFICSSELQDTTWIEKCSDMFKILLKQRKRGVPIDIERCKVVKDELKAMEDFFLNAAKEVVGDMNFNPASPKQLAIAYAELGINFPKTDKGNPSFNSSWMSQQTDNLSIYLTSWKKYLKARRDFCDAVLDSQELMPMHMQGRVYPEYNLFGATTGRFSVTSPNIQQIPRRDKEIGPLIRSIYVAEKDEQFVSMDFSQQEFRLFAHLVDVLDIDKSLAKAFRDNPDMKPYDYIAELTNQDKDTAKAVTLGKLYGMGQAKLGVQLRVTPEEAKEIIKDYDIKFPAAKTFLKYASDKILGHGFVTTIGGRRLRVEMSSEFDFSYKGANYMVQGSAAEQIIDTWLALDKAGIDVLISVHDEMNFSVKDSEKILVIKEIMESTLKLVVPMKSTVGIGDNWADCK